MNKIYKTIISNVKDDEGDEIYLKIVFKKIPSGFALEDSNIILYTVESEAFDSKGRYFYAEKLNKDFEYYVNKAKKLGLDIRYIDFEGTSTIYLEGGGGNDFFGLDEKKYSPYHLKSINDEIIIKEKELQKLKDKRFEITRFYNEFNLL